ncbi:MAG TPA: adenylate/guanylate cyclase domain-containing protein [Thermoanaerobaculia bacterium]|nr:adenylate/guanylate cyclase domain-containing protein [Thermoanaerobaculia bacterium]
MFVASAFVAGLIAGYLFAKWRAAAPPVREDRPPLPAPPVEDAPSPSSLPSHRLATVLVCDIRPGAWEERPAEVLRFLDDLHRVLAGIISDERGTVDRFAGDRTIAMFRGSGHAGAAVEAGRRMISNVEALARRVGLEIAIGVGIHTGPVDPDGTSSGDTIDTASRIEAKTREVHVPLLASEETAQRAGAALEKAGGGLYTLRDYVSAVQLDLFEEAVSSPV